MSIQHRSRIKTVADYSANITSLGACCYARDPDGPIEEYQNTCVSNGGHWQPFENDISEISCPELGATGCCCACSYVDDFRGDTGFFKNWNGSGNCSNTDGEFLNFPCYQGGLTMSTFCECSDKGGVFAKGVTCGVYTAITEDDGFPDTVSVGALVLCSSGSGQIEDDVRWPGACCTEEDANATCDDACSQKECSDIANAKEETEVKYWQFNYCVVPDGTGWPGQGDDEIIIDCSESAEYDGGEGEEGDMFVDPRTKILVGKRNFNTIIKDLYFSFFIIYFFSFFFFRLCFLFNRWN